MLPIVVFGTQLDLSLARDALQAGASGFVHAEMTRPARARFGGGRQGGARRTTGAASVRVDQ